MELLTVPPAWLMRPIAAPRMGHIGHKFEAPGDRGGRAVRAARLSDPRRAKVAGAAWPTGAVGTFWAHLGCQLTVSVPTRVPKPASFPPMSGNVR